MDHHAATDGCVASIFAVGAFFGDPGVLAAVAAVLVGLARIIEAGTAAAKVAREKPPA